MRRFSRLSKQLHYVQGLYSFRITALVVLAAGLILTGLLWASSRQRINQDAFTAFSDSTDEVATELDQELQSYEEILRSGAGLFKASLDVSASEWHTFIANYDLAGRYPGFASIGYVKAGQDAEGGESSVVVYAETAKNFPDLTGQDMYLSPEKLAAMQASRDSGVAYTTSRTSLDGNNSNAKGFFMYFPVYRTGEPSVSEAERRSSLDGFVYAAFDSGKIMNTLNRDLNSGIYAMRLYSGHRQDKSQLLYATANASDLQTNQTAITRVRTLYPPGSLWTVVFQAVPSQFITSADAKRPLLTAISGFIFSVTLASFLYMILLSRAKDIARSQHIEVQRAKDDLLSLASHQLRTPATGVKQYLGMVLQDYVGKITKAQRAMLDKAYESNERQLETINQILYVAKADAGRLKLAKSKFDVIEMVKDVVAEQQEIISRRGQKVRVKLHAKSQTIYADKQYLRMAIENLVSNASKYSYEAARIDVTSNQENHHLNIVVEDEGVGIAQDDMDKLFGKFSRIDNDLSVKAGGSGIGLYLAKQIAQMHGGDIVVSSMLHHGSRFTLSIPVKKQSKKS